MGGRNLPPHRSVGDSLTVFQEYRGFILDGGGFDGLGQNGHAGGHMRLSPAYKELLLEVDTMPQAEVGGMPAANDLRTMMERVARGYSDRDNGAGIRPYWVVDEPSAAYKLLTTANDATKWARDHRNTKQLQEFVHLMFTGTVAQYNSTLGFTVEHITTVAVTNGRGSFVFPNQISAVAPAADFLDWLATVTAHELGHTLIDIRDQGGFDDGEHETNPDLADGLEGPADRRYLMVRGEIHTPWNALIFSDTVVENIDLNRKESVEL